MRRDRASFSIGWCCCCNICILLSLLFFYLRVTLVANHFLGDCVKLDNGVYLARLAGKPGRREAGQGRTSIAHFLLYIVVKLTSAFSFCHVLGLELLLCKSLL